MSTLHEIPSTLRHFLDKSEAAYEVIKHPRDYFAQATAENTHTRGSRFAKCVMVWADNYYAMVVLRADRRLDLRLLRRAMGAKDVGLVREEEMDRLFPDCEVGAEPPMGKLYDLPMFVDEELAAAEIITFNAGTHEDAIRMLYGDFARVTEPVVVRCAMEEGSGE